MHVAAFIGELQHFENLKLSYLSKWVVTRPICQTHILCAHAHTPLSVKLSFFENLQDCLVPQDDTLLILGDFNAHVGQ